MTPSFNRVQVKITVMTEGERDKAQAILTVTSRISLNY